MLCAQPNFILTITTEVVRYPMPRFAIAFLGLATKELIIGDKKLIKR